MVKKQFYVNFNHLTDLATHNWFNKLNHVFYTIIIAYCQQNRYEQLAALLTLKAHPQVWDNFWQMKSL